MVQNVNTKRRESLRSIAGLGASSLSGCVFPPNRNDVSELSIEDKEFPSLNAIRPWLRPVRTISPATSFPSIEAHAHFLMHQM